MLKKIFIVVDDDDDDELFCGIADRQDHNQRFSPSQNSVTPWAEFKPAQNLISDFAERKRCITFRAKYFINSDKSQIRSSLR